MRERKRNTPTGRHEASLAARMREREAEQARLYAEAPPAPTMTPEVETLVYRVVQTLKGSGVLGLTPNPYVIPTIASAINEALAEQRNQIADWALNNLQSKPHAMAVAASIRNGADQEKP